MILQFCMSTADIHIRPSGTSDSNRQHMSTNSEIFVVDLMNFINDGPH